MPRYLVKLADDEYVEWSTVVDAPVTYIMDRDTAIGYRDAETVERTDRKGHSAFDMAAMSPDDVVLGNRAGEDEATLSLEQIREEYRLRS